MPQAEYANASSPIEVEPPPSREDVFRGMRCVDTSTSWRLPIIMEMVGELSRASDQHEVLKAFSDGSRKLNGPRGYVSLSLRGLQPGEYKITRMITDPVHGRLDDADPWHTWNSLPVLRGGFLGEIIRSPYPELIHHAYLRDDPVIGDALSRFGSMMIIPLFENGEPLNWSIQMREDPEGFTVEELEESVLRANLGGATVRNVIMTRQLREANERIHREIQQIARIQRALLPHEMPEVPGLSIATSYETFDTAGGDMYDLIKTPARLPGMADKQEILAVLIADASGHGPAAAVVSAMLNAILYAYPGDGSGPGAVLDHANRHLCAKQLEGMFVTAFLAAFHPPTRTLFYARAGHNPPLIKNAGPGGAVRRLDDVGGIPLGIDHETTYEFSKVVLERGQTLVLYTDGITDGMNPQRQMFGVEGIERALNQCSGEPACVINSITTALREHEAGGRPADDQTIVAIKVE